MSWVVGVGRGSSVAGRCRGSQLQENKSRK